MSLVLKQWIQPNIDVSAWEFYDLSCVSRDNTEDAVLREAVEAGRRIGSIFKEPTVTPTEIQKEKLGLKKAWGSPNGAMRRGWNGITISRDTIHIEGMTLGFQKPVLFERHAIGGEYGAGWKVVGRGEVTTTFKPRDGGPDVIVDERVLDDDASAVVTYHNPLDNVVDLAHHFFTRCLDAKVVPYVVTKKTVFKWQEGFWVRMKDVFEHYYKDKFKAAGLLDGCGGELQHLISDAATMQIIRWTGGGFGMAAHNYDGDMLTDEVAQVHRSPGFITSNLIGKHEDGRFIQEYEASHGTVADMWHAHLRGEETSLNPLGMVEALIGAMQYSARLNEGHEEIVEFTNKLRGYIHKAMVAGKGTRDLCGEKGLTTEQFVDYIEAMIKGETPAPELPKSEPVHPEIDTQAVDLAAMRRMFDDLDVDGNGTIDFEEFSDGLARLGVQPSKYGFKFTHPVE
eukprot:CAMPEP_0114561538 /NCGR_PEP_ID=MMETSP0114-20121206/12058_1 /TAXON_ID=31324 /ORGANISM="Goniomonas sp, Strain m" /LENGTH=453 /DNA_ID=CAMNT_0001747181 /DNA_START=162 /DNA_END=1523 /DNA_ORIENTATION=+